MKSHIRNSTNHFFLR